MQRCQCAQLNVQCCTQVAPPERPPLLRPGMCFQGSQCNNRITDSSHNWSVAVRVEVTSLRLLF